MIKIYLFILLIFGGCVKNKYVLEDGHSYIVIHRTDCNHISHRWDWEKDIDLTNPTGIQWGKPTQK